MLWVKHMWLECSVASSCRRRKKVQIKTLSSLERNLVCNWLQRKNYWYRFFTSYILMWNGMGWLLGLISGATVLYGISCVLFISPEHWNLSMSRCSAARRQLLPTGGFCQNKSRSRQPLPFVLPSTRVYSYLMNTDNHPSSIPTTIHSTLPCII